MEFLSFVLDFDECFENFTLSVLLRSAREVAVVTQEEVAQKLNITKSVISRVEKHAEGIRLSTLRKYAEALGKQIRLEVD
jgi:HTH-type transcriptional regulator / antitoxin HipB